MRFTIIRSLASFLLASGLPRVRINSMHRCFERTYSSMIKTNERHRTSASCDREDHPTFDRSDLLSVAHWSSVLSAAPRRRATLTYGLLTHAPTAATYRMNVGRGGEFIVSNSERIRLFFCASVQSIDTCDRRRRCYY